MLMCEDKKPKSISANQPENCILYYQKFMCVVLEVKLARGEQKKRQSISNDQAQWNISTACSANIPLQVRTMKVYQQNFGNTW
jgi:hypothetical protein